MNSTPQLRTILFEKLGLIPVKKTKTGPSTDADSLQKMADDHPIVEDLLRYREVEKLRSTYADALPPLIARRRSHPRHVQADRHHHRSHLERGAQPPERPRAHRRRSRDAARVHRRRRLRVCSPPTTRRSSCGCSRTSPRIPGSSTRSTAAPTCTPPPRRRCSASPEATVDDAQRRFAKVVNYGLAYGMEAYGLGQRLDIPTGEAAEILDAYFDGFPNVKTLHGRDGARGEGARLHHHDLRSAAPDHRARVRQLPHPPDGGAHGAERAGAGVGGRHLQARDDRPRPRARRSRLRARRCCSPCTTSSCSRCPSDERERTETIVREVMESVTELRVPLVVDIGFGPNWAAAK